MMSNKKQQMIDRKFKSLYALMSDLQTALGWARTAEERRVIHEQINNVISQMNAMKVNNAHK